MNFKRTNTKISLLEDYYNHFDEEKRLDRRHGQVEFLTAIKYIEEVLGNDKSKRILDVGAGTGKYSVYFDKLGYDVTAVELVERNIEVFKSKNSGVTIIKGNALSMPYLDDDSFDVVLLFGPMYHLLEMNEKINALKEARRVTKRGGIILVSYYMNEYAILEYGFIKRHIMDAIKEERVDEEFHMVPKTDDLYSMVRIEDIDSINRECELERLKIVSQDGAADYIRSELNKLTDEEFSEFMRYHLTICERVELLGASSHVLDVVRK